MSTVKCCGGVVSVEWREVVLVWVGFLEEVRSDTGFQGRKRHEFVEGGREYFKVWPRASEKASEMTQQVCLISKESLL